MSASPSRLLLPLAWTLFGLACAAWILTEPYRPARLIEALPQGSILFTTHERAAERWRDLAAHPVAEAIAAAAGESPESFRRTLADEALQGWIRRLAGTRVHLSYTHAHAALAEPAWVAASWVGGKGAPFRLWLSWVGVRDVRFAGRHHGRTVWEIGRPAGPGEPRLRGCLTEGMLILVRSRDPDAILHTLDGLDGLVPTLAADRTGRRAELARWAAGAPDHGYHFIRNMPEYGPAFFRVDRLDAGGFAASARLLWPYPGGGEARRRAGELGLLLGDLPQAMLLLPPRTFAQVLVQAPRLPILDEFASMVLTNAMPFASLAVIDGEHGGAHRGVKVPLAVAALPLESEEAAIAAARGFLGEVNRRIPVGWMAEPAGTNDTQRLFALTGTVKSKYSKWEGDDRAAFAVWNNWLVFATHTGALRRLLERTGAPEAEFEATRARWREALGPASPGTFLLRADRLGRTAAAWAQAYSLRLQMKDPEKARDWGAGLETTRNWARALETLGEIRGEFTEEAPWLHLRLTAGAVRSAR